VEIVLLGRDARPLRQLARRAAARLSSRPWVENALLHFETPPPELVFEPDTSAAACLGVPTERIASVLRFHLQGAVCGKRLKNGHEIDIRVQGASADETDRDSLLQLPVCTSGGRTVRLGQLGRFQEQPAAGRLYRRNRCRAAAFSLQCREKSWSEIERHLHSFFRNEFVLPEGYFYRLDHRFTDFRGRLRRILWTAIISSLAIYMVLAAASESLRVPFLILAVIPPALLPAVALLCIRQGALDGSALTGLIMSGGMAVNNGILILHQLRSSFPEFHRLPPEEKITALCRAVETRLEGLFLTTASTAAGTVPIFFLGSTAPAAAVSLALTAGTGVLGSLATSLVFLPPLICALPSLTKGSDCS
jgi:multidrug efflux pump subunit AcrB